SEPDFYTTHLAFYLDGVSFIHKNDPRKAAIQPKSRVWRKRGEGLSFTAKGSKSLAGGWRLHIIVAIASQKGVILRKDYDKMDGVFFAKFIRENFNLCFGKVGPKAYGKRSGPPFVLDDFLHIVCHFSLHIARFVLEISLMLTNTTLFSLSKAFHDCSGEVRSTSEVLRLFFPISFSTHYDQNYFRLHSLSFTILEKNTQTSKWKRRLKFKCLNIIANTHPPTPETMLMRWECLRPSCPRLLPYCPTRKTRRGRLPIITGCAMSDTREKRFQAWLLPSRAPAPHELVVRKMLTEALKIVLLFIIKNHLYTFDNEIRLQSKGGPIGLELTGVLAQLCMVWWDRELGDRLARIGLKLWTYKCYMDNINNIMTPPKLGVRFDGPVMGQDHMNCIYVINYGNMDTDERTMRLFQSVANSIHPSIEVEIDCPSQHHDGKLLILDLKVWIEKRNRDGSQSESRVLHEYYSKEISSAYVINARLALSWRSKRTILTQEVLMILLNCSVDLPWQVFVKHMNHCSIYVKTVYNVSQKVRSERRRTSAYQHWIEEDKTDNFARLIAEARILHVFNIVEILEASLNVTQKNMPIHPMTIPSVSNLGRQEDVSLNKREALIYKVRAVIKYLRKKFIRNLRIVDKSLAWYGYEDMHVIGIKLSKLKNRKFRTGFIHEIFAVMNEVSDDESVGLEDDIFKMVTEDAKHETDV
ncbi:Hypothetical predicted protein, partial [Paramuricea clavata]